MNKNLPHAIAIIREAMAAGGSAPEIAAAHALNKVGLLVDTERTRGLILRRTPAGGWMPRPPVDPELTDLEQQAVAWDQACERARQVAAGIQEQIGDRVEFQSMQVEGDRVLVSLHITDLSQWAGWRRYFGVTHDGEQPLPYVVGGEGYRDGVRVSVLAYDLPEVRTRAVRSAGRPFEFEGLVYDLALPQRDAVGEFWYFQGELAEDGMPLLSQDGRPERCTLASLVAQAGPLTAITATEGGETA
ncbi:BN159_2729 family protein [Streptomyces sp. NBRC 110035]|uniref:BN159_2729 family protein n=1 Tax=Streptomyces sp. NBRC 110035 TaxID=1547867 RepID=UPI000696526E|nr:BN159_2729 family protein [Streptomyces sp. NBRC 110035]